MGVPLDWPLALVNALHAEEGVRSTMSATAHERTPLITLDRDRRRCPVTPLEGR